MQHGGSSAMLRLSRGDAAMSIRVRGRHRFCQQAKPDNITLARNGGAWFASVTLRVSDEACARKRIRD